MDGGEWLGSTRDQALYEFHPSILLEAIDEFPTDGPLSLMPSSTVFHYGQCLFEGLKAYRSADGRVTLFRPDLNMQRMNRSAERIALPVRLYCYRIFCVTERPPADL